MPQIKENYMLIMRIIIKQISLQIEFIKFIKFLLKKVRFLYISYYLLYCSMNYNKSPLIASFILISWIYRIINTI